MAQAQTIGVVAGATLARRRGARAAPCPFGLSVLYAVLATVAAAVAVLIVGATALSLSGADVLTIDSRAAAVLAALGHASATVAVLIVLVRRHGGAHAPALVAVWAITAGAPLTGEGGAIAAAVIASGCAVRLGSGAGRAGGGSAAALGLVATVLLVAAAVAAATSERPSPTAPAARPEIAPQHGRAPASPAAPATATAPAPPAPADTVRAHYADLDAGRFARAWARLSPPVRAAFGGFASWRAGYATTRGHAIADLRSDGAGHVTHVLVARDATPCGTVVTQRFRVSWTVEGKRVSALSATRLGGGDPASAC